MAPLPGDSLIVRLYNITHAAVSGTIRFGFPVGQVFRVNMAEEEAAPLDVEAGAVQLEVGGGEVVTLKITPE